MFEYRYVREPNLRTYLREQQKKKEDRDDLYRVAFKLSIIIPEDERNIVAC